MSSPLVIQLSQNTPNIEAILDNIAHLHASCIDHDHTMATFLPPLNYEKILGFWRQYLDEVTAGKRHIWVELQPISSRRAQLVSPFSEQKQLTIPNIGSPPQDHEVAGIVSLNKLYSETGPFRAEVHKLLVSPNHRQKGVARRIMAALEQGALQEGKWNLMLDTVVGSPAESVYPKLGYIRVGVVPEYGYGPIAGAMWDEVWFYKDLRHGTL